MLLDQFGRPMRRVTAAELLERQAVASIGSVRQVQSGHPADGLTPPRLTTILRQAEDGDATAYLEMAEQMEEKDLHYAAVLAVRKRAIRSLEIQVDPGDETAAANEAADMVRNTLNSSSVKSSLIDIMDALGKGFSVSEIVWEREGKGLKLAGLELVDPRWFEFDRDNGTHIYLRDNAGPQPLRPDSYMIHIAKAKSGLAIRGGLARLAAWAYLFKNFSLKDWAIFLEAYGHPLRLGKYGPSSSPEDRLTLLRAARQIGVDMAAIIPKDMELEVITAATTGSDKLYEGNARFWDEQISKGVLGQVATTDAIAGGHAVGKIHEEVRGDIRDADAEQLAGSLQRDIAGAIVRLNFADRHRVALPVIRFVSPERADPKLMLELMEKGPKAGLRIAVSQIRNVFALREPEANEEVLTPPVPEPPKPDVPPVNPDPAAIRQTAARVSDIVPRDSVDALVDELIASGDMQEALDGEIGQLIEALGRAGSLDEVQDILAVFNAAPPGPVLDQLEQSTFAARVAGETGAPVR
ncbi:DUF935 domain-containing protein [Pseudotabrizicola algicola]|uniref:DUF935 domain-containing protein n=1 Tax=Pseudotabrizicola algicola TaxID=2709381 RepID=A0A6B3RWV5_9RHOB|nr:DUF935 domain-containing protein [Pseudotabrizicola algicola]NEX47612.1 DUF935 domain-containing protein [Pseudotabrizicola algicola]